jgi:hypothetical protein
MSTIQSFNLRTWATPLTIGSFVLMAVSGVLMFFDVVPGYLVFAHEWFSWFFLLGTAAHIAVNYRAFARHLRGGWGRAHVAVFSVLLVVSTFSFGRITAPQLKWPISLTHRSRRWRTSREWRRPNSSRHSGHMASARRRSRTSVTWPRSAVSTSSISSGS